MKRALMLALVVGCGGGGGKGAKEPAAGAKGGPLPIPDEMKDGVAQARLVGRMLFELDSATARGSDAVLAHVAGKPDERVQGWVALPMGTVEGPKFHVYFLGEVGGEVRGFYMAEVGGPDAAPKVVAGDGPVSADLAAMFRARQIAANEGGALLVAAGVELCERYNTVVIPGSVRGGDGHDVYLLAATTDPKANILAGHHRIHVAPDGTARAEPMSKSCIVSVPQPKEGDETLGAYVTHHLTPFPLESHVFASLNHRIQLVVATAPDRGWFVSNGEVVLFEVTP